MVWETSFGVVESNKKALAERGWNPLNYALLQHQFDKNGSNVKSNKRKIADLHLDTSVIFLATGNNLNVSGEVTIDDRGEEERGHRYADRVITDIIARRDLMRRRS